jgi:hypothetical protein
VWPSTHKCTTPLFSFWVHSIGSTPQFNYWQFGMGMNIRGIHSWDLIGRSLNYSISFFGPKTNLNLCFLVFFHQPILFRKDSSLSQKWWPTVLGIEIFVHPIRWLKNGPRGTQFFFFPFWREWGWDFFWMFRTLPCIFSMVPNEAPIVCSPSCSQ